MKENYDLAKTFMLNTQLNKIEIENRFPYNFEHTASDDEIYSQKEIELMSTKSNKTADIYKVMSNRKSVERFEIRAPVEFDSFSRILRYSYGKNSLRGNTVPSGGARYPISLYIVNFNIKNLDKGVYRYNRIKNSLESIKFGNFRSMLKEITAFEELIDSCSFLIISVGDLDKTCEKYGNRGYNLMLMDLGHISQNLYLTSQNEEIGCRAIYGIYNKKVNDFLNIKDFNKNSLLIHVLGKEALAMSEYYSLNEDDYYA